MRDASHNETVIFFLNRLERTSRSAFSLLLEFSFYDTGDIMKKKENHNASLPSMEDNFLNNTPIFLDRTGKELLQGVPIPAPAISAKPAAKNVAEHPLTGKLRRMVDQLRSSVDRLVCDDITQTEAAFDRLVDGIKAEAKNINQQLCETAVLSHSENVKWNGLEAAESLWREICVRKNLEKEREEERAEWRKGLACWLEKQIIRGRGDKRNENLRKLADAVASLKSAAEPLGDTLLPSQTDCAPEVWWAIHVESDKWTETVQQLRERWKLDQLADLIEEEIVTPDIANTGVCAGETAKESSRPAPTSASGREPGKNPIPVEHEALQSEPSDTSLCSKTSYESPSRDGDTEASTAIYSTLPEGNFSNPVASQDPATVTMPQSDVTPLRLEAEHGTDEVIGRSAEQNLPASPEDVGGSREGIKSAPDVPENRKTAPIVANKPPAAPRDLVLQCGRSYRKGKPKSADDLVCALLLADKIDIAYHFARCVERRAASADATIFPSSALIRCLALADIMSDQYGPEADDYAASMAEVFDKTDFFSRSEDTSYLALALGLLPLIMFRPSRAITLMQNVDVRLPTVRQIHKVALELSNSNVEFVRLVKSDLDTASLERQMKDLRATCSDWREKESRRNFSYIPTRGLWEYWLDPNRELGSLIDAVINDRRDRLESLTAIATKWKSKKHFDRERESADRAVRANQARTKPISDKAVTELRRHVDDALRQFESWRGLAITFPSTTGHNNDFIRKNRGILIQDIPEACKQLEQLGIDSENTLFVRASAHLLNRMLLRLQLLLNGKMPEGPVSIHWTLNRSLLAVPGVLMSNDFRIQDEPDNLEEVLLDNLGKSIDWEKVARDRAASDDFASMQQALRELELISPEREPSVRRELEKLQDKRSRDIENRLAAAKDSLSTAYAEGLLDDDQRNVFAHDFEQDAEKQERSLFLSRRIHQLQDLIARRRDEVAEDLRKELGTISELDPDNRTLVEQALEAHDFAAATEYMDYLVRGEKIPILTNIDKESVFFPNFLREFNEAVSDASIPGKLPSASEILKRFSTHSIPDLLKGDDRARITSIAILEAWNGFRKNRGEGKDEVRTKHVETVMREIGFTVKSVVPSVKYINNSYFAFEMTTEVLQDRDYCPIPHFGSQAKGRYRLLVFANKLDVHQVIDHATRDADGERTIVLYLDYLSENSRRDLAHRCKNMEPGSSFLLLDNYLVMFLLNKTNRLRSFFRAALRFTSGKPYIVATTPEMFFGRKRQLDSICSPTGACLVYGGRQLGKTALLKAAERNMHRPESGRISKYLDLTHDHRTNLGKSRPIKEIWGILAELLQDDIKSLQRVTTPRAFRDNIDKWLGPNRDRSRSILLLLDEADSFLEADRRNPDGRWSIVGTLKNMIRDFDGVFKVVFAGLHNVYKTASEPNNPLAHLGEPICVGAFFNDEVRDAVRMIREPLGVLGYEFQAEDRLIYRILGNTNYYPSFIQILCRVLLLILREDDSLATKDSPPYQITIDHVKKAYNQSQDEILDKFRLSLKLDSRYLVLALVIAYGIEESDDHPRDLDMWKIRQGALEWWNKGFKGYSKIEHIETLLNEMIGLGILRSPRPGHYALRNDKVLRLLRSSGSLENQLLEASEEEEPREFVEASFRRSLSEECTKRSVLTVQQERQLHSPNSSVAVIFGCDAAGLCDIDDTLNSLGVCTTLPGATVSRAIFDEAVKKMFTSWSEKDKDAKWSFLVVHPENGWDPEWIRKAMAIAKTHGKHIGRQKKIKVIFVGNPKSAFDWVFQWKTADLGDVALTLTPWNEDMIRDWSDSPDGMNIDLSLFPQLIAKTGAWGAMLEQIYQRFPRESHAGDAFRQLLAEEPVISPYEPEYGFGVDDTGSEIFRVMAGLSTPSQGMKKSDFDDGIYVGEPLPYSDLRDYFDDKPEIAKKLAAYLSWARLLGYARSMDDKWQLNVLFTENENISHG